MSVPPPSEAADTVPSRLEIAQRRILVVDDSRDSAESLAIFLRSCGHEVEVAYDGTEALAIAERFVPQVVLLDLGLPDLDGTDVAGRLRAKPGGRQLRLIATTGWQRSEDLKLAETVGFDAYLLKPLDLVALQKAF